MLDISCYVYICIVGLRAFRAHVDLLSMYIYIPTLNKIYFFTYLLTNPFNAKISFEAYSHIPVSKAEEGHYESYNLQGVYLCTLSICFCWARG